MDLSSEDVLFVGKGTGVVPWYRTGMPAFYLGCDWVGIQGEPPELRLTTSLKRDGHTMPELYAYKIIVLQQVRGRGWLNTIRRLQGHGIIVLYEVDDYLHGVRRIASHRAKRAFSARLLPEYELCMKACDGLIVSTEWLARMYRRFNTRTYVCNNCIEGRRYADLRLPERKTLNIGWAGGEGHLEAVSAWLPAVETILDEFPNTRFLSMGLPVAEKIDRPKQTAALPFISVENFPAALTNFDIAIAPSGRGNFYAAKSDLRFLETGALGIPIVADPFVYDSVDHLNTGMLADNPSMAEICLRRLVNDPDKRQQISEAARDYVLNERTIENGIDQWESVFVDVYDHPRGQTESLSTPG